MNFLSKALCRKASGLFVRLCLSLGLTLAFTAYVSPFDRAEAQQRNFFERLFGGRRNAKPEAAKPRIVKRQSTTKRRSTQRRSQASSQPSAPAPEAVEKVENASVVLVAGDFYAGALARGLQTAFAGDAAIRVVNRFNGNSGLVRDDFYNWPVELGPIIDELKPSALVFMAGANDRQPIRSDGQTLEKLGDEWSEVYKARIKQITDLAASKKVPLFWVATPPPRSGALSRDYLAFNAMLDSQLAVNPGEYIDIWDKFSTDEGAFTAQGPDVNGQVRRLRTNDGLNFTKAGRLKLAFYAEQPLRALLDGQSNDVFAAAVDSGSAEGELGTGVEEPKGPVERIAPVSLSVLSAETSGLELAGGPAAAKAIRQRADASGAQASANEPSGRLVNGTVPKHRVDQFSWPQ
ncbi:MAG: SGNH family hydrolase [Pseudomonadota bacterium]